MLIGLLLFSTAPTSSAKEPMRQNITANELLAETSPSTPQIDVKPSTEGQLLNTNNKKTEEGWSFSASVKRLFNRALASFSWMFTFSSVEDDDSSSSFAGTTADDFQVSANGAATYSIPIEVPPGTNGVQPDLSLEYNSQESNGLLGMGWSVSGLSSIVRCPQTLAVDNKVGSINFDTDDRFCVDGQRLIVTSGTYGANGAVYRTEKDTLVEYVSHISNGDDPDNGPSYFTATAKDGTVSTYGTSDSGVKASGDNDDAIRVWAIKQINDRNDNFVIANYETDSDGEYYLDTIYYSGNGKSQGQRHIEFTYQDRDDSVSGYIDGSGVIMSKMLQNVTTYVNSSLVKKYKLRYSASSTTKRNLLQSVQECGANSACLPKTTFIWTQGDNKFKDDNSWGGGASSDRLSQWGADINADGLVDFVYIDEDRNLKALINSGDSFSSPQPWGSDSSSGDEPRRWMIDINGDGLPDYVYNNSDSYDYMVMINNGSTFESAQPWGSRNNNNNVGFNGQGNWMADMNGDGLVDYTYNRRGTKDYWVMLNNGTGFDTDIKWGSRNSNNKVGYNGISQWMTDVNGDGITDYMYNKAGTKEYWVMLNTGTDFETDKKWTTRADNSIGYDGKSNWIVDMNGDGLLDYTYNKSGKEYWVMINNGNGYENDTKWGTRNEDNSIGYNGTASWMVDMNGDNMGDLVYNKAGSSEYWVMLNNGSGFDEDYSWGSRGDGNKVQNSGQDQLIADVNGDGLNDFNYINKDTSNVQVLLNKPNYPDLLSTITNGVKGTTDIEYTPLTDDSVYTKGDSASGTRVDVQTTMYAVSSHTQSDGRGNSFQFKHEYAGAKRDRILGWLGFESNTVKDQQAGTHQKTTYHQDVPLIGISKEAKLERSSDDALLAVNTNNYEFTKSQQGVYTVYKTSTVVQHYSFKDSGSSTLDYTTTTSFTYDDNKTRVVGISQAVDNSQTDDDLYTCYQYNTGSGNTWWQSYFPRAEKTLKSQTDCKNVDFSTWDASTDLAFQQYAYDGRMNLVREQTWDDNKNKWIAYSSSFDYFGNIISTSDALGNTSLIFYEDNYNTFPERTISPPKNGLNWQSNECATEGDVCSFSGTRLVRYGADSAWQYRLVTNRVSCDNSVFGDPLKGAQKGCYISSTDPTIDPTALTTTASFEPNFGIQTSATDANGNVLFQIPSSGIDPFGRVTTAKAINPSGQLEQVLVTSYDSAGSAGIKTSSWERITWGSSGNWSSSNKNDWMWESSFTDGLGRYYKSESKGPDSNTDLINKTVYDEVGRVKKEYVPYYTNASTNYTAYTYDIKNRPYTTTSPDGAVQTMIYNNVDDRKVTWQHSNPSDGVSGNTFVENHATTDSQGKVIITEAPDGGMAFYEYDQLGRRTKITDPEATNNDGTQVTTYDQAQALDDSKKTVFTYNSLGQIMTAYKPELGTSTFIYNDNGLMKNTTDAKGQQITYEYDALSRVKTKTTIKSNQQTESVTQYTYDVSTNNTGKGALSSVSTSDIIYTYTYYPTGELKNIVTNLDTSGNGQLDNQYTTAFSYDALGRTVDTTYPDTSVVKNLYNYQGYIEHVQLQKAGESNFETLASYSNYTSLGQAQNMSYANDTSSTYSYDVIGRTKHQSTNGKNAQGQNQQLSDFTYQWNKANKLLSITDNISERQGASLNQSFEYNNMGRLKQAVADTYGTQNYSYDFAGNITQKNNTQYVYDQEKKHQLVRSCPVDASNKNCNSPTNLSLSYDDNGNMYESQLNTDNTEWTYTYNTQNRITQASSSEITSTFTYDDGGRRIFKQENNSTTSENNSTYYISPHYEIVKDAQGNQQHTKYIFGPNGVISTITQAGDGVTLAWEKHHNRVVSLSNINTGSLQGMFQYLVAAFEHTIKTPYIALLSLRWLFLGLFISFAIAVSAFIIKASSSDEPLGKLRNMFAQTLGTAGVLSPETVNNWSKSQSTQWVKRNKWWARVVPIVIIAVATSFVGPTTSALASLEGNGIPVAGQTLYFHQDHIESSVMITNENGVQVNQVVYEPYGEINEENSTGNDSFRPKFTGKERDFNTDLTYFGARYYDGHIGRFLSPDPGGQYFSPYVYTADDPLTHIDPDGEAAILIGIIVVSAIIGAYVGGSVANDSYNPANWDWTSGKTWAGIAIGATIGGITAGAGAAVGAAVATGAIGTNAAIAAVVGLSAVEGASWAGLEMGLNAGFDGVNYTASEVISNLAREAVFGALFAALPSAGGKLIGKTLRAGARRAPNPPVRQKTKSSIASCPTSFTEDTEISTSKGSTDIEDIEVGDEVWSYNEETQKIELKPVSHLFTRIAPGLIILTIGFSIIETTPEHPFYVPDKGWVIAENLELGDEILQKDGSLASVESSESKTQEVRVYNFEVEENHNYFVSEEEVLVHNTCMTKNQKNNLANTRHARRTGLTPDDILKFHSMGKRNRKKPKILGSNAEVGEARVENFTFNGQTRQGLNPREDAVFRIENFQYNGSRSVDSRVANQRHHGTNTTPANMTWHHLHDFAPNANNTGGRGTMVLMPRDVHQAHNHSGGVWMWEQVIGPYGN